jgi:hypothetical protein
MIYALIFLAMPVDYDALINQLGDKVYSEREIAARQLYKSAPESIWYLKRAFKHSDPEIKYRSKQIYVAIRDVFPSERHGIQPSLPSIWNLSNSVRFRDGQDLALKYYNRVFFNAYEENKNHQEMLEWEHKQLEQENKEIAIKAQIIREFSGFDLKPVKYVYNLELAGIWATKAYIGDCREAGMSYADAQDILDQMVDNRENMCHLSSWGKCPGILVGKQVEVELDRLKEIGPWIQKLKRKARNIANIYMLETLY